MQKNGLVTLILVAAIVAGCWSKRQELMAWWHQAAPKPAATKTTVYSWRDKEGVMHYSDSAEDRHARKVVVDTGRITPLAPLPPAAVNGGQQAVANLSQDKGKVRAGGQVTGTDAAIPNGVLVLKHVSDEMKKKQLEMQEAKMDAAIYNQN